MSITRTMKQGIFPIALMIALFVPGYASALTAERPVAQLDYALQHLPLSALAGQAPDPIRFVNVGATMKLAGDKIDEDMASRLALTADLPPLAALAHGTPATFEEKSGIRLADVGYLASVRTASGDVSLWGLQSEAAAGNLMRALRDNGFKDIGQDMIANGEPGQMDLTASDPANPWRGMTGQSYVVGAQGQIIFQAPALDTALAVNEVKPEASAGQSPMLRIALDGINAQAVPAKLIQALVIGPDLSQSSDVLRAFTDEKIDQDALRAQLETAMAKEMPGLPVFFTGIIADLQKPGGPALMISLAYPDCAIAQRATDHMLKSWTEQTTGVVSTVTSGAIVQTGDGCAAVLTADAEETGSTRNPPFTFALSAMMRRDLSLLRIGR
ncbi:hypothetical protein [Aquamicrobium sp.]|uniref:hypothetical protein n=1 Tax=Aquamicrobium sp. TaxID=1872579 RepID=UPI002588DE35|nr:hypothetical protein [Aquamicrobium sp.]MCK9549233.1 hypothetical protein [Aquamicrobium sp.]